MIVLAINTAIVTTGIVVFLIVTLILVGILLFAKAKLTAKGDVQVSINGGERVITSEPGNSLLSTLSNQKIFGVNLFDAGLADLVLDYFRSMIAGPGAVRATLKKVVG